MTITWLKLDLEQWFTEELFFWAFASSSLPHLPTWTPRAWVQACWRSHSSVVDSSLIGGFVSVCAAHPHSDAGPGDEGDDGGPYPVRGRRRGPGGGHRAAPRVWGRESHLWPSDVHSPTKGYRNNDKYQILEVVAVQSGVNIAEILNAENLKRMNWVNATTTTKLVGSYLEWKLIGPCLVKSFKTIYLSFTVYTLMQCVWK